MKTQIITFVKSTSLVLFLSLLISFAVWLFKGNYIAAFILSVTLQYILFSFIGTIVNNYFLQQITIYKNCYKKFLAWYKYQIPINICKIDAI